MSVLTLTPLPGCCLLQVAVRACPLLRHLVEPEIPLDTQAALRRPPWHSGNSSSTRTMTFGKKKPIYSRMAEIINSRSLG